MFNVVESIMTRLDMFSNNFCDAHENCQLNLITYLECWHQSATNIQHFGSIFVKISSCRRENSDFGPTTQVLGNYKCSPARKIMLRALATLISVPIIYPSYTFMARCGNTNWPCRLQYHKVIWISPNS